MSSQIANGKIVVIYATFCGLCYDTAPVFDAIVDTDSKVEDLQRHLFQGGAAHELWNMLTGLEKYSPDGGIDWTGVLRCIQDKHR